MDENNYNCLINASLWLWSSRFSSCRREACVIIQAIIWQDYYGNRDIPFTYFPPVSIASESFCAVLGENSQLRLFSPKRDASNFPRCRILNEMFRKELPFRVNHACRPRLQITQRETEVINVIASVMFHRARDNARLVCYASDIRWQKNRNCDGKVKSALGSLIVY